MSSVFFVSPSIPLTCTDGIEIRHPYQYTVTATDSVRAVIMIVEPPRGNRDNQVAGFRRNIIYPSEVLQPDVVGFVRHVPEAQYTDIVDITANDSGSRFWKNKLLAPIVMASMGLGGMSNMRALASKNLNVLQRNESVNTYIKDDEQTRTIESVFNVLDVTFNARLLIANGSIDFMQRTTFIPHNFNVAIIQETDPATRLNHIISVMAGVTIEHEPNNLRELYNTFELDRNSEIGIFANSYVNTLLDALEHDRDPTVAGPQQPAIQQLPPGGVPGAAPAAAAVGPAPQQPAAQQPQQPAVGAPVVGAQPQQPAVGAPVVGAQPQQPAVGAPVVGAQPQQPAPPPQPPVPPFIPSPHTAAVLIRYNLFPPINTNVSMALSIPFISLITCGDEFKAMAKNVLAEYARLNKSSEYSSAGKQPFRTIIKLLNNPLAYISIYDFIDDFYKSITGVYVKEFRDRVLETLFLEQYPRPWFKRFTQAEVRRAKRNDIKYASTDPDLGQDTFDYYGNQETNFVLMNASRSHIPYNDEMMFDLMARQYRLFNAPMVRYWIIASLLPTIVNLLIRNTFRIERTILKGEAERTSSILRLKGIEALLDAE